MEGTPPHRMLLGSAEHRSVRQSGETDLGTVFAYLAAATLGLLAGTMLLIAVAIVPFWTGLEPSRGPRPAELCYVEALQALVVACRGV